VNSPENDPLAFAAAIAPHVQGQLRIAVVTETYPPEINGVAVTLRYLVEGLLRSGHAVQLVRPCQHRNDLPANAAAFNEILVPGMRIPRYDSLQLGFPSARLLEKRWKSQRPDVVHVATEGPLGWSALSAARTLGIACSSDFHTNFHRYSQHYGAGWLKRPIAAYLRTFHNRARYTFVPTSELRDELEGIGFWYTLMLALLLAFGRSALQAVVHMIATGLVCTLLYKWLKQCTLRPRPYQVYQEIDCAGAVLDRFSFPSGHTMHAVAFTAIALFYYGWLAWLLLPFALLVATSRLVLGLHYPSDVMAGAVIAAVVSTLSVSLTGIG